MMGVCRSRFSREYFLLVATGVILTSKPQQLCLLVLLAGFYEAMVFLLAGTLNSP